MKTLRRHAIVPGLLSLTLALPAFSQAEDEPPQRDVDQQAEQVLRELIQELQLQEVELDVDEFDPREDLERRRLQAIQRRVIQLQLDQPLNLDQQRAADPLQLEVEPVTSPWAERSRDEVVAGLDDGKFSVRESAEAFLLTDNTLGKAALKDLIKQAKSPEQRQRLLRVAEHHVLREMREKDFGQAQADPQEPGDIPVFPQSRSAAVGYSYEPVLASENPQAELPGVRVIATMPGFPGHAHLRRGDIIVQINGTGLSLHQREHDITNWVRWQIASKQAGEQIDFTVLRNGKMLKVEMICAEGAALDHMYTTDAFEAAARKEPYRRAWEQARDAFTADLPKPKMLTPKPLNVD